MADDIIITPGPQPSGTGWSSGSIAGIVIVSFFLLCLITVTVLSVCYGWDRTKWKSVLRPLFHICRTVYVVLGHGFQWIRRAIVALILQWALCRSAAASSDSFPVGDPKPDNDTLFPSPERPEKPGLGPGAMATVVIGPILCACAITGWYLSYHRGWDGAKYKSVLRSLFNLCCTAYLGLGHGFQRMWGWIKYLKHLIYSHIFSLSSTGVLATSDSAFRVRSPENNPARPTDETPPMQRKPTPSSTRNLLVEFAVYIVLVRAAVFFAMTLSYIRLRRSWPFLRYDSDGFLRWMVDPAWRWFTRPVFEVYIWVVVLCDWVKGLVQRCKTSRHEGRSERGREERRRRRKRRDDIAQI